MIMKMYLEWIWKADMKNSRFFCVKDMWDWDLVQFVPSPYSMEKCAVNIQPSNITS